MRRLCSQTAARSLAIPSHGTVRGPDFLHLQIREIPFFPKSTAANVLTSISHPEDRSSIFLRNIRTPQHTCEPASVTLKIKAVFSSETLEHWSTNDAESKRSSTDESVNVDTTQIPNRFIIMQFLYFSLLSSTRRPIDTYRTQILGYKPVIQPINTSDRPGLASSRNCSGLLWQPISFRTRSRRKISLLQPS